MRRFRQAQRLAFTPDQCTLYIADSSSRRHIRKFAVQSDGVLTGGAMFVDMDVGSPGVPDGLAVSVDGRVFSSGPGGVWVIEPDGKVIGVVMLSEMATNCTFGDTDGCGLYITAGRSLYRLRLRKSAYA